MISHGNYFIETIAHLGAGSFGTVEKIMLRNLAGKECGYCARKILNDQDDDPDLLTRFRREVKYQDECLHKNVVQIFICSMYTKPAWFVMELAECTLQDELDAGTLTNRNEKIDIILMIARGLAHIHSKGYYHRDIKPLNILKFSDATYKISDFGIARHMDPTDASKILTQVGVFLMTPKYFDAHSVVLHGYSKQSDIYSLGVIIEELGIDGFDDVVAKCTDRKLIKRYLNVEQLIADIEVTRGVS